jgi:hypothetical protein
MNSASGCGSNALRSVANLAVSGVSAMRAGYPYLRARRGRPVMDPHTAACAPQHACMPLQSVLFAAARPQASVGTTHAFNSLACHPQSPQESSSRAITGLARGRRSNTTGTTSRRHRRRALQGSAQPGRARPRQRRARTRRPQSCAPGRAARRPAPTGSRRAARAGARPGRAARPGAAAARPRPRPGCAAGRRPGCASPPLCVSPLCGRDGGFGLGLMHLTDIRIPQNLLEYHRGTICQCIMRVAAAGRRSRLAAPAPGLRGRSAVRPCLLGRVRVPCWRLPPARL